MRTRMMMTMSVPMPMYTGASALLGSEIYP
jgi:hypothetical protein